MMKKTIEDVKVLLATALVFGAMPILAATYYKAGSDVSGKTTFNKVKDGDSGWATTAGGSYVSSIADWAGSDFHVTGSRLLRTPNATNADVTFPGRSLTIETSGQLMFKNATEDADRTVGVEVPDLRFDSAVGGIINHGCNNTIYRLYGKATIADGSKMVVVEEFNSNGKYRKSIIDSDVHGGETSSIAIKVMFSNGNITSANAAIDFNSMTNFYGTLVDDSSSPGLNFTLNVNGEFNGTVTSLPGGTQSATFDYDGLPAGKGIRIKGTNPGTPILQKLRVYSATADFSTPGLVVATFEDISSPGAVENLGWGIQYSDSASGTFNQLALKAQTNALGQVALVTTADTYYKTGSDTGYNSSLPVASALSSGWSLRPGGGTYQISAADIASSDFVVSGENVLRTCGTQTFGGRSLRIVGPGDSSNTQWLMKYQVENVARDTQIAPVTTVNRLVFSGGAVYPASNSVRFKIAGNVEIESGRSMVLTPLLAGNAASPCLRRLEIAAPVAGGDDTTIDILKCSGDDNTTGTGDTETVFDDLENFTGVFNDRLPASWADNASFIHFAGNFGGRIGTMETNNIEFIVNYDGLPAGKGLRAATTAVPGKLKTKTVFYSSDTAKFTTDGTVLATFPAGTTVDPLEFNFKYAATAHGERTEIPLVRTETGANDEVLLVVDVQAPAYAKMVADPVTGDYSWHFYLAGTGGSLGDDVTETCALSVPDDSIAVIISSSGEFNAVLSEPGNAKEYRIASFVCTGDANFATAPFLAKINASGLSIDPAGHRVTVPFAFANGNISAVSSSTAGSEFCVIVPSGETQTLDGPAISGTVRFVKAGEGLLYCAKANQTYTGGNAVEAGILAAPYPSSETYAIPNNRINQGDQAVNENTTKYKASQRYFGATNTEIKVESGAGFDLNSNYGYNNYNIVLNGGTLWNTLYSLSSPIHQRDTTNDGVSFRLTADSSLRFRSSLLVSGGNPIDLGGHKLSIYCGLGYKYVHLKNSITNGTVEIVKGDAAYNKMPDTGSGIRIAASVDARGNVAIVDYAGLRVDGSFAVSNYTAKLPEPYGTLLYTGSAQMTVTGAFRPEGRYFPGITMADGSTLDLGAWDFGTWGAFKPSATGARNGGKIDFQGGTVTIDLSGRSDLHDLAFADDRTGTYLLKWGEGTVADPGADVAFSLDSVSKRSGGYIVRDATGVKLIPHPGFAIKVR